MHWFDYLPFHAKEKFHVYHSPARSERSMCELVATVLTVYCTNNIDQIGCNSFMHWFDYLPFHAKEKCHVYHSPARSERSMSVLYCKTSINVNNISYNHKWKPAIFGTRIATLNCLHETLDQHSAFVYCCCAFKPICAESATMREREREREKKRVRVCEREAKVC